MMLNSGSINLNRNLVRYDSYIVLWSFNLPGLCSGNSYKKSVILCDNNV